MCLYFGKADLSSKIPFMNISAKGCWPKGNRALLVWYSVDKALRTDISAEYDNPASYRSVRKLITSEIGRLKKLHFAFSQNWLHFVN